MAPVMATPATLDSLQAQTNTFSKQPEETVLDDISVLLFSRRTSQPDKTYYKTLKAVVENRNSSIAKLLEVCNEALHLCQVDPTSEKAIGDSSPYKTPQAGFRINTSKKDMLTRNLFEMNIRVTSIGGVLAELCVPLEEIALPSKSQEKIYMKFKAEIAEKGERFKNIAGITKMALGMLHSKMQTHQEGGSATVLAPRRLVFPKCDPGLLKTICENGFND